MLCTFHKDILFTQNSPSHSSSSYAIPIKAPPPPLYCPLPPLPHSMSHRSPRIPSSALSRASRLFWCHQCHRTVRILPPPSAASEVFCSRCSGQFIQELNIPWPPPPPPPPPSSTFPYFLPPHPHLHLHHLFPPWAPIQRSPFPGRLILPPPPPPPRNYFIPRTVNPGDYFTGPNLGELIEELPRPPPMPPNPTVLPGDYFTGPNLGELIEELTQNDRSGPPPALASSIDALPTVQITASHLRRGTQCPVCKEEFDVGEEAREMPCHHVYHSDCIVPWLRMHNSCPVCRLQLPGCEPDARVQRTRDGRGSVGGGGGGGIRGQQRPERWSPFTLLSAFRNSARPEWNHRYEGGDRREQSGDPMDNAAAFYSWWRSLFLL